MEGMAVTVLQEALLRAGATVQDHEERELHEISKQDMMDLGLSGCADASIRRNMLLKRLKLPEHMSANAMLQALNLLFTFDELKSYIEDLEK